VDLDFLFRSGHLIFHSSSGDVMSRKTKVNLLFYDHLSDAHLETFSDFSGSIPRVGDIVSFCKQYSSNGILGSVAKIDHEIKFNDYGNNMDKVTIFQDICVYLNIIKIDGEI
jgi:hypothetical protein